MVWEVIFNQAVLEWIASLEESDEVRLNEALEVLRRVGPVLGRPLVDRVKGSGLQNLKELRPLGTNLRCLFVFDLERRAVILVGGDKSGRWREWYRENVPLAELRFTEHQRRARSKERE